ncbi:hypothetical protein SMACR_00820 [Sordaria macrospora]|nr:hypothetical protein SMACR_00820 [Sordaria macrospora]
MTWIKPSLAWMLYLSGYSYKDPGQERILAIKMKREDFLGLLGRGVLTHGPGTTISAAATNISSGSRQREQQQQQQQGEMASDSQGGTCMERDLGNKTFKDSSSTRESKRKDRLQSLDVKIQWDPERTVWLDSLNYRSIQIGIPAGLIKE